MKTQKQNRFLNPYFLIELVKISKLDDKEKRKVITEIKAKKDMSAPVSKHLLSVLSEYKKQLETDIKHLKAK